MEQPVDERVALGDAVDVTAGGDAEWARGRQVVRHGSYRVLAHDDPLRERVVGDRERIGIDRIEDDGARIGQDAEHRLDRVGPDAQIVHDVTGEAGRLERRQIERHVRRRQHLAPGFVGDRGTDGVEPVRRVVLLRDGGPGLERLRAEHEAQSGMPSARVRACAARPSRPFVSTVACTAARLVLVSGAPTSCQTHANDNGVVSLWSATTSQVSTLATGSASGGLSEIVIG